MTADVRTEAERQAHARGYETPRPDVLAHVPGWAGNILELGCSNGALGAAIKARQGASVLGVEIDPAYASIAQERLDRVVVSSAEPFAQSRPDEAPFDCVICADVLEHLVDPWGTFNAVTSWLQPGGVAIVSLPNVFFYRALKQIARERRWPREDSEIFDRTHLRWFSLRDARELVEGAGLAVETIEFRLWQSPRREPFFRALTRTPLRPLMAAQHIVVGRRS